MIFSRNWLAEYIEGDILSAEEIAERLGLHSFEVEGVERVGDDAHIDIDVLPNRAHDALSYLGMAGEVALVFEKPFKMVDMSVKPGSFKSSDMLTLSIEDSLLVPRATKRVLRNVKVGPSPEWLQRKLEVMGQRSINNVVDVTNFVMYEFGQPVHAFDYNTFTQENGKASITIRRAHAGETIETLDGASFELTPDMFVIADNDKALDIAGIKGGKGSGINEDTSTIVVSVCNFNPENIRQTSRTLGLRTDASTRFEKGLSPEIVHEASHRVAHLLQEIAGAEVSEDMLDVYPVPQKKREVILRSSRVNKLLGTNISPDTIEHILSRLEFSYEKKEGDIFVVTPPMYRLDIEIEEDVIEEVARVYGYETIPEEGVPSQDIPTPQKEFYWINRIKDSLVQKGFVEISTYTFVDEGEIELQNALAEDKTFLRNSLAKGMTGASELTKKIQPLIGPKEKMLFEVGKVFTKEGERWQLISSVDVSDILEEACGVRPQSGEDNQIDVSRYIEDLPEPDTELDRLSFGNIQFKNISNYPFVLRDVAVWVPESVAVENVEEIIKGEGGDLLVRLDLFDEYPKDGRVSYAFKLVFQSNEKTLTDEEVNVCTDAIYKAFEERGWEIR